MTGPAIEGDVYTVVHVLALEPFDVNVHREGLKLPPAPPSLHDTVPVGVDGLVEVSVTVAL